MNLTEQQTTDLVSRIIAAVHPTRIILFGSTVRGQAGPKSDIDVLVVACEDAHRRKTAQAIYRHLLGSGLPVDVVVARPSDLEKYSQSVGLVYREALLNGRDLYVA
jgi:predicted nucleotidyltransferase